MAYIKDREEGNDPAQLVQGINQGVKVFGDFFYQLLSEKLVKRSGIIDSLV